MRIAAHLRIGMRWSTPHHVRRFDRARFDQLLVDGLYAIDKIPRLRVISIEVMPETAINEEQIVFAISSSGQYIHLIALSHYTHVACDQIDAECWTIALVAIAIERSERLARWMQLCGDRVDGGKDTAHA